MLTTTEARSILGLPSPFTSHDLKRAYRRTASANHPDRGGSTERMVLVNEAYAVLTEVFPNTEAFYPETGHHAAPEHPAEPYVRRVSIVLAALWWTTGIFDLLDEPRRLRSWILIGLPFAYLIVWPVVRVVVRCGIHIYNFGSRLRERVEPFASR